LKYLVDVQLPKVLDTYLNYIGLDSTHVLNFDLTGKTTDNKICKIANTENRIVVTKDLDFLDTYMLNKMPRKLLLVATGNISNKQLLELFKTNIFKIDELFKSNDMIQLTKFEIIIY